MPVYSCILLWFGYGLSTKALFWELGPQSGGIERFCVPFEEVGPGWEYSGQ